MEFRHYQLQYIVSALSELVCVANMKNNTPSYAHKDEFYSALMHSSCELVTRSITQKSRCPEGAGSHKLTTGGRAATTSIHRESATQTRKGMIMHKTVSIQT